LADSHWLASLGWLYGIERAFPGMDPARFLKINRSCIVNRDSVQGMTPDDSKHSSKHSGKH